MNVGDRFGMLVVTAEVGPIDGERRVMVKCDCGAEKMMRRWAVKSGKRKSCGCAGRKNSIEGLSNKKNHPLYSSWLAMLARCNCKTDKRYPDYGGRGIKVCERWHNLKFFAEDMGERPPGMSMDRIDNDGNYEPGNVRWATTAQQAANKKNSIRIDGMCLAQKCRQVGIRYKAALWRVSRGEDVEHVVNDLIRAAMSSEGRANADQA